MQQPATKEPRILRLYLGIFALAALTMLLAAAWLRSFVPARHALRVRDLSGISRPGR